MSYTPSMHGSFSAYPPFSQQPQQPQQPQPLFGGGYNANANAPPQAAPSAYNDLSAQTAQRIATLQAKLDKRLGPEYISQRPGPSGQGKLTYAEGWKIINLANEVFGFNGWSSSITSLAIDYVDFNEQTQRYCVGVTAIVKVILRDGVYHEDVGFGMLDNCKQKGMAIDKCKKEAVTDALKRTLRNFGNLLGNCLYDKEYTKEVVKIAVPPPKFDRSKLHRRPEYTDPPTGPSNTGPSNMGPPLVVPAQPSTAQTALLPSPQTRAQQQSLQQIGFRPQQEPLVTFTVPRPQRPQQARGAPAKPAPATNSTSTRSDILAALAGSSPAPVPVPTLSPLLPTNALLRPQSAAQVPQSQSHPHQPCPPQNGASKPQLKKDLSQEEFPEFAEGDDSFYNDLNLESFDASTTLVDTLDLGPSPPPAVPAVPAVPANATGSKPGTIATDAKGKGRMSAIMLGLMEDSPQPDRSFGFGIGPPPAYASPVARPTRTALFTTASGGAIAIEGTQSGGGGGGFVIPAGVTRPNRSVPPPPPPPQLGRTAGVKRSAGDAFISGKTAITGAPVVGGNVTVDRTVLGALEVGFDGAVLKRVRR